MAELCISYQASHGETPLVERVVCEGRGSFVGCSRSAKGKQVVQSKRPEQQGSPDWISGRLAYS
jgi:hypothetical protein